MKTGLLLLWLLMMVAAMASAQTASHSSFASPSGNQNMATSGHTSAPSDNDLRGCLSGSKGNYTLLDHNGKTHKVTGDDHALWNETGHEVDLTGKVTSGNTFQETEITDIASRCWNFHLN
jgi:hypothetical protein